MEATAPDGSHVLLAYPAGDDVDPRDVCFTVALKEEDPAEADENCEVRGAGVTMFSHVKGPWVVAGYAGASVEKVTVDGVELPLSRHRGFLALLPPGARPTIAPVPQHRVRRRGVVFNDEVGENIMQLSETQILSRFGEPAAREGSCLRYELVGHSDRGFRFCFERGAMTRAFGYGY
jgi:hypothetical protein